MTALREIMTEDVVTARPKDDLLTLASMMDANDVGFVPIMDDKFLGVVTDRDIVTKGLAKETDYKSVEAQQIMTEKVITGLPDMDVMEASRLMKDHQISRLLVVEDDQLKGVVSLRDISVNNHEETAGDTLSEIKQSGM
ncbi:CBS domain-containing protein [Oceanobacillus piezotolerans]|uniref:CBS domain-containing protein n=1 Tax=Oceanobacillus piezotolerans TaxID=2448030 RepID=A0A498D5S7_9BACI|nr:CBS domain-containing protein [Oceanobacillus piezotolerans]RLL42005.1 CBS domain-containing protein [Oceanobacillus piezotolerans]